MTDRVGRTPLNVDRVDQIASNDRVGLNRKNYEAPIDDRVGQKTQTDDRVDRAPIIDRVGQANTIDRVGPTSRNVKSFKSDRVDRSANISGRCVLLSKPTQTGEVDIALISKRVAKNNSDTTGEVGNTMTKERVVPPFFSTIPKRRVAKESLITNHEITPIVGERVVQPVVKQPLPGARLFKPLPGARLYTHLLKDKAPTSQ